MKVFISWSGPLSKKLGEAFRKWLPAVLQTVQPYFTPDDVEKGARWNTDIAQELEASAVGILCLTKENLEKPWIMFEAGALSKQLDTARVCPILFGLEPTDLTGPLVQFQATPFTKDEVKKLIASINDQNSEQKLPPEAFDTVFEKWWPDLEKEVGKILAKAQDTSGEAVRKDRELLEEILELSRLGASGARSSPSAGFDPAALHAIIGFLVDAVREYSEKGNPLRLVLGIRDVTDPLMYLILHHAPEMHADILREESLSLRAHCHKITAREWAKDKAKENKVEARPAARPKSD